MKVGVGPPARPLSSFESGSDSRSLLSFTLQCPLCLWVVTLVFSGWHLGVSGQNGSKRDAQPALSAGSVPGLSWCWAVRPLQPGARAPEAVAHSQPGGGGAPGIFSVFVLFGLVWTFLNVYVVKYT